MRVMLTDVGRQETKQVAFNAMEILPCKRVRHAVKKTITVCGHTKNAEMLASVMINETVNRHLMNRAWIGSFAETAVWRLPACETCCYRRLPEGCT